MSLHPHVKCLVYTYQTNLTKYLVKPSICEPDKRNSIQRINQLIYGYKIEKYIDLDLYIYQHGKIVAQYTFTKNDWRSASKIKTISFFIHNHVMSYDFKYLDRDMKEINPKIHEHPTHAISIIHKIDGKQYYVSWKDVDMRDYYLSQNDSYAIEIQQYKGKIKHGMNARFRIDTNPKYKKPKNIKEENQALIERKRALENELLELQRMVLNEGQQNRVNAIKAQLEAKTYFHYDITELYPITMKRIKSYMPEFNYSLIWKRTYKQNKLNGPWKNKHYSLPHCMIQQGRHKDNKLHGMIFTFNKYRTKNRVVYYYYDLQIYINGQPYGPVRTVVYKQKKDLVDINIYRYNYEPFLIVKKIPDSYIYKPSFVSTLNL